MFKILHFPEYTDLRIIALGLNVAYYYFFLMKI